MPRLASMGLASRVIPDLPYLSQSSLASPGQRCHACHAMPHLEMPRGYARTARTVPATRSLANAALCSLRGHAVKCLPGDRAPFHDDPCLACHALRCPSRVETPDLACRPVPR